MRALNLCFLLFFCIGCALPESYTVRESYVEEKRWDPEKGIVKSFKETVEYQWEN